MWIVYQLGLALALLLSAPVLLLRRRRHYLPTLAGRMARYPDSPGGPSQAVGPSGDSPRAHDIWLHAVSVGEVAVATTLIRRLPERLSVLVTTVTPTGQQRAIQALSPRATVTYLPFDLGFAIQRFLRAWQPKALILVESELWPLVLRHCQRRQVPVYLINGRISDRSYRRMRALRPLLGALFRPVTLFLVQSDTDRQRFVELGAREDRVVVTGNLKYDSPEPSRNRQLEQRIERLAAGRPILVAGSTMEGEDRQVLDAFVALGAGQQALLILAPRHPERFDSVAELVASSGLSLVRRSSPSADLQGVDVLLLDSLGELSSIYRLADAGFIGGTLVPTGGHNPLEPARFAKPIAVGPSMENFREMAEQFDREHAWARAGSSSELAAIWRHWLIDPPSALPVGARARQLFDRNRGALERTLERLAPVLERPS